MEATTTVQAQLASIKALFADSQAHTDIAVDAREEDRIPAARHHERMARWAFSGAIAELQLLGDRPAARAAGLGGFA